MGIEVIHSYNELGYELDIYIPSSKIAIEYDGFYWHKNKLEKDPQHIHRTETGIRGRPAGPENEGTV